MIRSEWRRGGVNIDQAARMASRRREYCPGGTNGVAWGNVNGVAWGNMNSVAKGNVNDFAAAGMMAGAKEEDLYEFKVSTGSRSELIDITAEVRKAVGDSGVADGVCLVFVPHTTAAVTINEGADPAVRRDIKTELDKIIPWSDGYAHAEGNSAAHIKTSLVGSSEMILVAGGQLLLGTWQSVYFCEFDGPRQRRVYVKVTAD